MPSYEISGTNWIPSFGFKLIYPVRRIQTNKINLMVLPAQEHWTWNPCWAVQPQFLCGMPWILLCPVWFWSPGVQDSKSLTVPELSSKIIFSNRKSCLFFFPSPYFGTCVDDEKTQSVNNSFQHDQPSVQHVQQQALGKGSISTDMPASSPRPDGK